MRRAIIIFLLLVLGCSQSKDSGDSIVETISVDKFKQIQKDSEGKVLVVNIFATWCPPCEEETPEFIDLYKSYGGKEFELVALSIDTNKKDIDKYITKYNVNYPVYHITPAFQSRFMANKVPTTLIFKPNGEFYTAILGALNKYSLLKIIDLLNADK